MLRIVLPKRTLKMKEFFTAVALVIIFLHIVIIVHLFIVDTRVAIIITVILGAELAFHFSFYLWTKRKKT